MGCDAPMTGCRVPRTGKCPGGQEGAAAMAVIKDMAVPGCRAADEVYVRLMDSSPGEGLPGR